MQWFWFLFYLLWDAPYFVFSTPARDDTNSGRIPSNVQIYSKKDLKGNPSYHLLLPSNQESNGNNPPSPYRSSDHIIDSNIKLPQPLEDLPSRHKVLYQRALAKDYDYAQFGEPCKVFTVDELDEFIGVFEDSIEPHEGESQDRSKSPHEKAEQLEQLFNQSRAICDFKNLLKCHKHFLTCACAHPSMGVNREGLCGVNIGHPCELSGRTLKKYGVLVTPEMNPIKCLLQNAECVMENQNDVLSAGISPIRKICKCRVGFWGATCSRRNGPVGIKLVPPKEQKHGGKLDYLKNRKTEEPLSEEVEGGRPLWMNDIGATAREYFMHPEEIKEKLMDLMNEREMHPSEQRADEAQKLVNKLELDADKEEMVVNELHLRKLAILEHGNPCDPKRQLILDNPPVSRDVNHRWTDPHPEDIKSWQLGLLQQKKPFCNVYKLLRCDEASKVCQCKSGLELETSAGGQKQCKIPFGHNCDVDFEPILEFDPLKDRKRFSEMDPPTCITNTECIDKPLFFQKKCWCLAETRTCAKHQLDEEYSSMAIHTRSTLKRGDSCDPKLHQRLFNYQSDEDPGYDKRIMVFREILDNPEIRLCDIESYLNCSDTTRTCQCWKQLQPSQLEDGDFDCVAMNMASCGRTFEYGKYMYDNDGAQLWQVEKAFQNRFLPGCFPGANCAGGDDPEWAGRCVCQDPSQTGESCETKKSILATAFSARSIPQNDVEEMNLLRVYYDLNKQTVLMEQLMTSGLNDACDTSIGLTLDRIVKFWREIANSNDGDKDKRTLPHYIAATKWTKYLVSTVQGNSASLCNATLGLRCHRTSGRCGCHRGARWIGDRCYLDPDEQCDSKPGAEWVITCMPGTKCLPTVQKDTEEYRCASCGENGEDEDCENGVENEKENDDGDEELDDTWNVEDDVEGEKNEKSLDVRQQVKVEKLVEEDVRPQQQYKYVSKRSIKLDAPEDDDDYEYSEPKYFVANDHRTEDYEETTESNKVTTTEENPPIIETERSTVRPRPTRPHVTHTHKPPKKPKDDAHLMIELRRMLKEILTYRGIPLGGTCLIDDEESFSKVLENLQLFYLKRPPNTIPMAYVVLSTLYWKGVSFCNRTQFLKCTWDAVCGCSTGFGLVEEHGECRLREHHYCSKELKPINGRKKIFGGKKYAVKSKVYKRPPFLCRRGNSCIQVDFGLPVCAKNEKREKEEGKVRSQKVESGSSWTRTREHIYSLCISVVIRMIITRAIV